MTISALRRAEDWQAWAYLAIGFAASVTANVLHVDPAALHWTRYAVAAVPPVAAMLALTALLRQVYWLAAGPDTPAAPALTMLTQTAPADSASGSQFLVRDDEGAAAGHGVDQSLVPQESQRPLDSGR